MAIEVISTSMKRTVSLGRAIARVVQPGDVIALRGQLGAGKTQWVRGLAEGLGADPRNVSSPTFVVMQEYPANPPVLHIDAYRIHSLCDLETTGWTTELAEQSVSVIEWADRIASELPENRLELELVHLDENRRQITIHPTGNFENRVGLMTAVTDWIEQAGQIGCKCPICNKEVSSETETFPFCSPRCKQVDLGRWLTGAYRIVRSVDWENDDLSQLEPGYPGEPGAEVDDSPD